MICSLFLELYKIIIYGMDGLEIPVYLEREDVEFTFDHLKQHRGNILLVLTKLYAVGRKRAELQLARVNPAFFKTNRRPDLQRAVAYTSWARDSPAEWKNEIVVVKIHLIEDKSGANWVSDRPDGITAVGDHSAEVDPGARYAVPCCLSKSGVLASRPGNQVDG